MFLEERKGQAVGLPFLLASITVNEIIIVCHTVNGTLFEGRILLFKKIRQS